jgi:flagellar biosynthetic protein FlhB
MAEDDDESQRTELPTGKRLGEARARGQLPISREVSTWTMFVGVLVCVAWLIPMMASNLVPTLRMFLEQPHAFDLANNGVQGLLYEAALQVGKAVIFVFGMLCLTAILGTVLQTGWFYSTDLIEPSFAKLNPIGSIKRLFSTSALTELGKSFVKMVVLGAVVFSILMPLVRDMPAIYGRDLPDILALIHREAIRIIIAIMIILSLIAVSDYYYTKYMYIKSLRMTKAEVKDEHKQLDGDPLIKRRLQQIRLEKARKRMMAQVPKADVVVTNPTHYAIALKYDNTKMAAPVVLAKGIDVIAERIRNVAQEHRIPLVSNPPLARTLYDTVELNEEIPTQLYRAVAEVISFVYRLKKKRF